MEEGAEEMKEKAIFEIGNIIRVRNKLIWGKLSAQEIIDSYEYQRFKITHPELCKLVENKR